MNLKRTIRFGVIDIKYEAVIQGLLSDDFEGCVVVHDPELQGGMRRAFLLPKGRDVPKDHIVVASISVKGMGPTPFSSKVAT